MTTLQIILLPLFGAAAMALRWLQMRGGFDENGLAVHGDPAGILLPVLLLLAALFFSLTSRSLPGRSDAGGGLSAAEWFDLSGAAGVAFAVVGAFLLLGSAALSFLTGDGALLTRLFAAFTTASGLCLLAAVFRLRRGGGSVGPALLVPVCCLVLRLIFLYRTDAADPVLARTYVGLLAFAALTLSHLERAAFAFRSGSPRLYVPVSAMAVILLLAVEVEPMELPELLFCAGFLIIELAFLVCSRTARPAGAD